MWLPGYERHEYPGLAGKSYQYTHNPKGCMHTTEGGSISGAMSAYAPYPPHLIYDWRNRRRVQHVRLDRAAYSAMDGNDDDYMVQVELVGFAADTRAWPEQALRNIALDVVGPLERAFGIPRRIVGQGFKDGRDGLVLATPGSPIRLSAAGLRDFSGWLGHQHLPAPDDHWDPGALPMARILSYLEDDLMAFENEIKSTYGAVYGHSGDRTRFDEILEELRAIKQQVTPNPEGTWAKGSTTGNLANDTASIYQATGASIGASLPVLLGKVTAPDVEIDADDIAQLAAELRRTLPGDVAAELGRKLAG